MPIIRTITVGTKSKGRKKKEPVFKRKPKANGKHLVVVESPAKAKTIEKILGKDYKVLASMGHLRDLPQRTLGVDIENGFTPEYVNSTERENVIKELRKEANKSKDVYLATDPDREGEAISWHLSNLLDVNIKDNVRIAFHEITPTAIKEAIKHPKPLDMNRVDAQQARRVLDRLVGYKISPWLWKQVYRGLSAGRVQSVATRLICEREEEIKAFKAEEYWYVNGVYSTKNNEKFTAKVIRKDGKDIVFKNGEEAQNAVNEILNKPAIAESVTKSKKQRKPKAPYTTSTMQQDAVNKLGFGSKKTMMLAQILYEGVEIPGHGHVGLITYMRTDSTRISDEMITSVREYINNVYGEEYLPKKHNVYSKSKEAQDAHEAIRPTNLKFAPEILTKVLTRDQLRLYTLIWNRFIASQMTPQIQQNTVVLLKTENYTLKANGMYVLFDGFTILQSAKEKKKNAEELKLLPNIQKGEEMLNISAEGEQHFTSPPARYTEASLIKTLEEKGIGRPSTYAPILDTIQKRKYVTKEGKQFIPTEVGFVVTDLLKKYFSGIVDIDFTANLESWLDKIAEGKATYKAVLQDFYDVFKKELESAKIDAEKDKKQEISEVKCEKCGAFMIIKLGRYGKYLACPNYPKCSNIKPFSVTEEKNELSDIPCEKCGKNMVYRTGPYGRYLKCVDCGINKAIVEDTGITCPKCKKGHMVKRRSKRGRIFYGCNEYPNCDMALWNEPIDKFCEECHSIMTKKTYKNGTEKILCSNAECITNEKKKHTSEKEK